jgi:hypothetical protein
MMEAFMHQQRCLTYARGTLFFCDDKKLTKAIKKDPSKCEAAGSHYCGHRFVLTGAIFDQLRAEMSEDRVPARYAEAT